MPFSRNVHRSKHWLAARAAAGLVAALGLSACVDAAPGDPKGAESLDELVVTDPGFTFATSRQAVLQLYPADAAASPKAVEIMDAEGRRLMKGAFSGPVSLDLKLPATAERRLRLRLGRGADVVEQDVALDDAGRASASY